MAFFEKKSQDQPATPAIDSTTTVTPRWNSDGLVTAIAVDVETGAILMVAHMNAEALSETLRTGAVTYWSRSRQCLWRKGETSGHRQELVEMRVDCDQDAFLLRVRQTGAACHTGRRSCFYRRIENGDNEFHLVLDNSQTPVS